MASVYFPSLEGAEVIEAAFVNLQGGTRRLQLLVDTGFSGRSSVILDVDAVDLFRAALSPTQVAGARLGDMLDTRVGFSSNIDCHRHRHLRVIAASWGRRHGRAELPPPVCTLGWGAIGKRSAFRFSR